MKTDSKVDLIYSYNKYMDKLSLGMMWMLKSMVYNKMGENMGVSCDLYFRVRHKKICIYQDDVGNWIIVF